MIRVRFQANPDDYRPINWPLPHPYWCSGYAGDGSYSIIVAYADDVEYIRANWPEAKGIDILDADVSDYQFTDRFPKPKWLDK